MNLWGNGLVDMWINRTDSLAKVSNFLKGYLQNQHTEIGIQYSNALLIHLSIIPNFIRRNYEIY